MRRREGLLRAHGWRAFLRSQRWRRVRPAADGRPLPASCPAEGRPPMMTTTALRHRGAVPHSRERRSTQFAFKIRRNVYVIVDTSKGLLLGHEAVATRPGRPPIRGKV